MKTKEEFKPTFLSILVLTCAIYSPFSFIINFICGVAITVNTMLQLWASLLIFAVIFIIALTVTFTKKINYKKSVLNLFGCAYAAISFVLNVFVMFVEGTHVWSLYSLLLVCAYSVIFALLYVYLKLKSFLLTALVYYAVSIISFLILTAAIAGCSEGNQIMLAFGIFSAFYALISVVCFFVKRSIEQIANDEKAYKPMFD